MPINHHYSEDYQMNKDDVATIESIVTDQGNGSSWCSACNANIDLDKMYRTHAVKDPWRCPNCDRLLTFGSVGGDFGGSDF